MSMFGKTAITLPGSPPRGEVGDSRDVNKCKEPGDTRYDPNREIYTDLKYGLACKRLLICTNEYEKPG